MLMSSQIESTDPGKEPADKTFLTGANIEAKTDDDLDNLQNSQAIVEANLMKDPTYARKFGNMPPKRIHKRT